MRFLFKGETTLQGTIDRCHKFFFFPQKEEEKKLNIYDRLTCGSILVYINMLPLNFQNEQLNALFFPFHLTS